MSRYSTGSVFSFVGPKLPAKATPVNGTDYRAASEIVAIYRLVIGNRGIRNSTIYRQQRGTNRANLEDQEIYNSFLKITFETQEIFLCNLNI